MAVNIIAVIAAAVASMIVGMAWYSPMLFGNAWIKLSGFTKKDMEKAKKKGMAKSYVMMLVASFVMAYVIAYFIDITRAATMAQALAVGAWAWLGFIATTMLNSVLWEGKPAKLYAINVAHMLVSVSVMATIVVYMA